MIFYANMPYDADSPFCQDGNYPNGLISDGEINGGLSHEHMESVTDPIPNDAWTIGAGPFHGFEVGDVCVGDMGTTLGTAPNGSPYNQVINGHPYWYQTEWSNYTHSCVQRVTLPKQLPTANETVTAGNGTDMTFDAGHSTAPQAAWPSSAGSSTPFSMPRPSSRRRRRSRTRSRRPARTPPAWPCSTRDGLSAGTGGIVVTGKNGFQPAFTVSQACRHNGELQRAHDRERQARHQLPLGVR